ncbi:c-type cytochrome [Verrucomicrobia bacterium]|nr:c-type cytochrome [Verrucomicrobiota bacterium]
MRIWKCLLGVLFIPFYHGQWVVSGAVTRPARLDDVEILKHLQPNPIQSDYPTLQQMFLPEGFRADQIASEPDVLQPIAFTFDELGRIWVVEAFSYPEKQPEGQGKDRILIFEDFDGDGSFEDRKIFAEDLNLVSGIEVGFGGVWLGAAPQLLFIPDENQDDQPDGPPQVLLDGFGYQDTHETLNSFVWGPDGWLYGNQGVFNYSRIGKPDSNDAQRTEMRAGVWRYHPMTHKFEAYAHGGSNQWGLDYDRHGQWFMTHCRSYWGKGSTTHVIRGGYYWNQSNTNYPDYIEPNPPSGHDYLRTYLLASARYGHGEGGAGAPGSRRIYGGHSHIGTMLYQGNNWPAAYRNQLYTHNLHGHQLNVQVNERDGSGYNTVHAGKDMLMVADPRYIAIDLKYGPDGAVYINDWYDTQHCHNPNAEQWERGTGRMYRIQYEATYEPTLVNLSRKSDRELAWLQLHQNAWFARTARRLLQERSVKGEISPDALEVLHNMSVEHANENRRLRAFWALYVIGAVQGNDWLTYLRDESEYVRANAIEFMSSQEQVVPIAASQLVLMALDDPSAFVRLRLAAASIKLSEDNGWKIIEALARHTEDAGDRNLPSMIWFALAQKMPANLERAFQLMESEQPIMPVLEPLIVWYAAKLKGEGLEESITYLQKTAAADRGGLLNAIYLALQHERRVPMPRQWDFISNRLYENTDEAIRLPAEKLAAIFGDRKVLPKMRSLLADTTQSEDERRHALEILNLAGDEALISIGIGLLDEPAFQSSAINLLARFDHPESADALLARLDRFEGKDKVAALNTMTTRSSLAVPLLDAVIAGKLERDLLTAYYLRQLQKLNSNAVSERITRIWGQAGVASEEKAQFIESLDAAYREAPLWAYSADEGKKHFQLLCSSCHQVAGTGVAIVPDLTAAGSSGSRYFIESMIDPNAVIGQNYQVTEIEQKDGEMIAGLLVSETESSVVIKTLTDTVTVSKLAISDRQLSEHSMMPEGLLDGLNERQRIELIKYLTTL